MSEAPIEVAILTANSLQLRCKHACSDLGSNTCMYHLVLFSRGRPIDGHRLDTNEANQNRFYEFHFLPENQAFQVQLLEVQQTDSALTARQECRLVSSINVQTLPFDKTIAARGPGMDSELYIGQDHSPLNGWLMSKCR